MYNKSNVYIYLKTNCFYPSNLLKHNVYFCFIIFAQISLFTINSCLMQKLGVIPIIAGYLNV